VSISNILSTTAKTFKKLFETPVPAAKIFYDRMFEVGAPQLINKRIEEEVFYKYTTTHLALHHADLCYLIEREAMLIKRGDDVVTREYEGVSSFLKCLMTIAAVDGIELGNNELAAYLTIDGFITLYDDERIDDASKAGLKALMVNCGFKFSYTKSPALPLQTHETISTINDFIFRFQKRLHWLFELHKIMHEK
jgi:hypothetical protein